MVVSVPISTLTVLDGSRLPKNFAAEIGRGIYCAFGRCPFPGVVRAALLWRRIGHRSSGRHSLLRPQVKKSCSSLLLLCCNLTILYNQPAGYRTASTATFLKLCRTKKILPTASTTKVGSSIPWSYDLTHVTNQVVDYLDINPCLFTSVWIFMIRIH